MHDYDKPPSMPIQLDNHYQATYNKRQLIIY